MNTLRLAMALNRSRVAAALTVLACAVSLNSAPPASAQATAGAVEPAATPAPGPNNPHDAAGKTLSAVKGSITGRVMGDGGEPLSGIPVFARTVSSNRSNVGPVMTDEGGNFKIDELLPGLYNLSVAARGFIPDPSDAPAGQPAPLYRPGESVTLRLVKGGVITGTVLDAGSEPLVAITVRAYMVRDLEGGTNGVGFLAEDQTDDRGVYRLYGLRPGVYVVVAGGDSARGRGPGPVSPYENEAPTFFPAGTRDTASEVTVRVGQETAGIDIRFRGERGRRVTGTVTSAPGQPAFESGLIVSLAYAQGGLPVGSAFIRQGASERSFSFEGVADGEYEVQARSMEGGGNSSSASAPRRVLMSGADVTGLQLTLVPLASLSGNLVIEPLSEAARAGEACKEPLPTLLPQETIVAARRDETAAAKNQPGTRASQRRETAPDLSGSFTLRGLEAGRYRVEARPGDENWYVRAVQLPAARPGAAHRMSAAPAARESLELKPGQQLAGLFVRIAAGAASLSGRLAPAREDAPMPSTAQVRVHLVPAEREQADDPLRYYETAPASDGVFVFKNLAPGKYLLLARPAETATPSAVERPAAGEPARRTRLRHEAEAANTPVEMQPCQRASNIALRFPPASSK